MSSKVVAPKYVYTDVCKKDIHCSNLTKLFLLALGQKSCPRNGKYRWLSYFAFSFFVCNEQLSPLLWFGSWASSIGTPQNSNSLRQMFEISLEHLDIFRWRTSKKLTSRLELINRQRRQPFEAVLGGFCG